MLKKPIYVLNENINWYNFSKNESDLAVDILEENIDKIEWEYIIYNKNQRTAKIIKNNLDKMTKYMSSLFTFNPHICDIVDEDFVTNFCEYGHYNGWLHVSRNPAAIKLLEKNIDKISWSLLSENSAAIDILNNNQDKISWYSLGINSNAYHLIDKIYTSNYQCFCRNTNPKFLEIVEQHINELGYDQRDGLCDWQALSKNPSAINILKNNLDKVLSYVVINPNAIEVIEMILEKIENNTANSYWMDFYKSKYFFLMLCENPNAIHIIEKNIDRINYIGLSRNHNAMHLLTKFDYNKMKELNSLFNEELVAYVFNPKRLLRFCEKYNLDFYEINEIY